MDMVEVGRLAPPAETAARSTMVAPRKCRPDGVARKKHRLLYWSLWEDWLDLHAKDT